MSIPNRLASHLRNALPKNTSSRTFTTTARVAKEEWPQRYPLGPFYERILESPPLIPDVKPEEPPNSADPEVLPPGKKHTPSKPTSGTSKPKSTKRKTTTKASAAADTSTSAAEAEASSSAEPQREQTPQERMKIIFGSKLVGPREKANYQALRKSRSTLVAGVLIPPKPDEPDNCCMSGCVNCVWERYREEMEEWSAADKEAQRRLKEGAIGETKIAKDFWDDKAYEGIPVGIQEFMKQEKRLKERHAREGTVGG